MASKVDAGITPPPDGDEVHSSREEATPDAAALFGDQSADRRFRETSFVEKPDGGCGLHHGEVPSGWLHALLHGWEDGPGEADRILSVGMIDGARYGSASVAEAQTVGEVVLRPGRGVELRVSERDGYAISYERSRCLWIRLPG